MKSETEADKMGTNFRKMAKEMKVSSTEIATAAVTFYRQGLDDSAVNERLEWVTKYAKVANIAFDEAAELVTAATNSMSADIQGDVQRVVDVFLYLGDAAATSGEEIGKAMQKASASATQFGLSFEWLGAYIATVSEQTRQAPESIGNAFNTMMARMHSIKQNGFNSEDETKINDVAKALKGIDVQLMDSEGNWRKMSDIYADIADKWGELDDKQKSYIATTMAGTRQQNVFFALMNDMSKGLENGSRAWELYNGALDAAGSATEKYAIWEESIAAAQGSLQASLESLYATLANGGAIKTFYGVLTGIVDGLNNLGGVGPVVVAVIGAIATTIAVMGHSAAVAAGETLTLAAAGKALSTAFSSHPVMLFATALLALIPIIGAFGAMIDDGSLSPEEKFEAASKAMEESHGRLEKLQKLQVDLNKSFNEMYSGGAEKTAAQLATHNRLLEQVSQISPTAKSAIDDLKSGMMDYATVLGIVNSEFDKLINTEQEFSREQALKKLVNFNPSDGIVGEYNQSSRIRDWLTQQGFDGSTDSFEKTMRQMIEWRGSIQYTYDEMTEEFSDLVSDVVAENWTNAEFSGSDADYSLLAQMLWSRIVGDPDKSKKALEDKANEWINLALDAVGAVGADRAVLADVVRELIVGENGQLDAGDFTEETNRAIQQWVANTTKALKEAPTEDMYQALYDSFGFDASTIQFTHLVDFDEWGDGVYE